MPISLAALVAIVSLAKRASARSAFLPQPSSQSSYQRTLRGPFSDLGHIGRAKGVDDDASALFDELLSRKNRYSNTLGASQLLFG